MPMIIVHIILVCVYYTQFYVAVLGFIGVTFGRELGLRLHVDVPDFHQFEGNVVVFRNEYFQFRSCLSL